MEALTSRVTMESALKIYPRAHGADLAAEVIIALTVDNGTTVRVRSSERRAEREHHEFDMPAAQATRLRKFYNRFIAQKPPGLYDCMSALDYWMGWQDDAMAASTTEASRLYRPGKRMNPERLRPFMPYFIMGQNYASAHAVLALPDGARSLGVHGPIGDLTITLNHEELAFRNGRGIYSIVEAVPPEEFAVPAALGGDRMRHELVAAPPPPIRYSALDRRAQESWAV